MSDIFVLAESICRSDMSDSLSTLTNEETSHLDVSPDQPFPLLNLDSSPKKHQDDFMSVSYPPLSMAPTEADSPTPSTSTAGPSTSQGNHPIKEQATNQTGGKKSQNSDSG